MATPPAKESDGCLVASAVFKTVESSYAALVGSIPSLPSPPPHLREAVHLGASAFLSNYRDFLIRHPSPRARRALAFLALHRHLDIALHIFIKQLWRSCKTEDIYLKDYASARDLHEETSGWFRFYNTERRPLNEHSGKEAAGFRATGVRRVSGAPQ